MNVVITANGKGERMKGYGVPKHELPYKGKSILQHLLDVFPKALVLTHYEVQAPLVMKCPPTNSRKETLNFIRNMEDVLIVDCDIWLKEFSHNQLYADTVFFKFDDEPHFEKIDEHSVCSGLYYVKSVKDLISRMTRPDSIYSGMQEATQFYLNTIHLGTPNDYSSRF